MRLGDEDEDGEEDGVGMFYLTDVVGDSLKVLANDQSHDV